MITEGVPSTDPFDVERRYARVIERRPDGFVEFRFSIGDPTLFVEMFLRDDAFDEFCAVNRVELLDDVIDAPVPPDDASAQEPDQWNWSMHDATHHRVTDPKLN